MSPVIGITTGLLNDATGIFTLPAVPYIQALNLSKDDLMGSSVTSISNEVTKAINDLQKIIKGSSNNQVQKKTATTAEHSKKLTDQQTEIMKRRMEQKASFATIAKELRLPEKEVHREFLYAYQFIQKQNQPQTHY